MSDTNAAFSYLMTRLLGGDKAFGIGSSVEPTTQGIWAHVIVCIVVFFSVFFFVVVVLIVVYLSGGRGWQPEHHRARYRGTERAECLPHPHGTLQVSYCCDQTDKAYDSKVFSVTTLLSSLVLYNGVKIIDSEVLFLVVLFFCDVDSVFEIVYTDTIL